MKPHRIRMTHNLLLNYGLYRKMEIYVSIELVMVEKNISEGLVRVLILTLQTHFCC